jgi:hypothetical protein
MMRVYTKIKLLSIGIVLVAIFIVSNTAFCQINNESVYTDITTYRLTKLDKDYSLCVNNFSFNGHIACPAFIGRVAAKSFSTRKIGTSCVRKTLSRLVLCAFSNPSFLLVSIEPGNESLDFPEGYLSLTNSVYTGIKKVLICTHKVNTFKKHLLNVLITDIPPPLFV